MFPLGLIYNLPRRVLLFIVIWKSQTRFICNSLPNEVLFNPMKPIFMNIPKNEPRLFSSKTCLCHEITHAMLDCIFRVVEFSQNILDKILTDNREFVSSCLRTFWN